MRGITVGAWPQTHHNMSWGHGCRDVAGGGKDGVRSEEKGELST